VDTKKNIKFLGVRLSIHRCRVPQFSGDANLQIMAGSGLKTSFQPRIRLKQG
jgi:hypothetical protein